MITRLYLLSTTSRSWSIGGLVMPSATGPVSATFVTSPRWLRAQQGYQPLAHFPYGRVHQGAVELRLGGQFHPRGLQAAGDDLLGFGAPPAESPLQLLPARRGQEDQKRVRHGLAHLPGPLEIDLQQGGHPRFQVLDDGGPRRSVSVA